MVTACRSSDTQPDFEPVATPEIQYATFSNYGFSFAYPNDFEVEEYGMLASAPNDTSGLVQAGTKNDETRIYQVVWIGMAKDTWEAGENLRLMLDNSIAGVGTSEDVKNVVTGEVVETTKAGHQMLRQYFSMTATNGDKANGIVGVLYCDVSEALYQLVTINDTYDTEVEALQDFQRFLDSFTGH